MKKMMMIVSVGLMSTTLFVGCQNASPESQRIGSAAIGGGAGGAGGDGGVREVFMRSWNPLPTRALNMLCLASWETCPIKRHRLEKLTPDINEHTYPRWGKNLRQMKLDILPQIGAYLIIYLFIILRQ